jgi:uncharacterized membrane protein YdjX (TVP38/TMEM64 family)
VKFLPRIVLGVFALLLLLAVARALPLAAWSLALLELVQAAEGWGILLFALLYIPACLVLFPDVILNTAAGLFWGAALATLVVSLARVAGASALFLVVRRFSGGWQRRRAAADPRFAAVARAVQQEGFKIALMLRLSPLFPLPAVHVALALTPISWRTFAMTTFLGALPRTAVFAYLGAGARSLSSLAGGASAPALPGWAFWSGLLLTLAVTWWLTRFARRTLRQAAVAAA